MKKISRVRINAFLERYRTDRKVLDVGSGGSSYAVYFPDRLTVDIDPLRKPDLVADIHALPFADGEFDAVLCTEVLEHVKDPRKAAAELMRVLSRGGMLILTTRFVYPVHDAPHDYWRFTEYILRDLFAGGDIVELTPESGPFSTLAVLLQRIEFQTKLRGNRISKFLLRGLIMLFMRLDVLVTAEYGDIGHTSAVSTFMTSGYYLAVRKR
jgi:SAM-dependent methyltransferase